MDVGKLGDAKALEGFGQAGQPDALASDFHVEAAKDKPVGGGHKRGGAGRNGGLLEEAAAGRRGLGDGLRLGSGRVTCRRRTAVTPRCGARRAVCRPENHHQGEAHERPDQPHRPNPFNQNAAQGRVGCADDMTHRRLVKQSQVGETVSEEEQINSARDHPEPGASRLAGDDPLLKVEDTANPEKLAGCEHHEDGK